MDIFAPWHLLLILLIVLVIFGPKKLGDVGEVFGRAVRDFKNMVSNKADDAPSAQVKPPETSAAPPAKEGDPTPPS